MQKRVNSTGVAVDAGQAAIENVLRRYEEALNASDIDKVMALFTADGVFMPPNMPSMAGAEAIRNTYTGIFQAIAFETELTVEEIVQTAPGWAFVRTSSNGHVTVKAAGQRVPDANHELFIFQKDQQQAWKIARYAFSSTLPLAR